MNRAAFLFRPAQRTRRIIGRFRKPQSVRRRNRNANDTANGNNAPGGIRNSLRNVQTSSSRVSRSFVVITVFFVDVSPVRRAGLSPIGRNVERRTFRTLCMYCVMPESVHIYIYYACICEKFGARSLIACATLFDASITFHRSYITIFLARRIRRSP